MMSYHLVSNPNSTNVILEAYFPPLIGP